MCNGCVANKRQQYRYLRRVRVQGFEGIGAVYRPQLPDQPLSLGSAALQAGEQLAAGANQLLLLLRRQSHRFLQRQAPATAAHEGQAKRVSQAACAHEGAGQPGSVSHAVND